MTRRKRSIYHRIGIYATAVISTNDRVPIASRNKEAFLYLPDSFFESAVVVLAVAIKGRQWLGIALSRGAPKPKRSRLDFLPLFLLHFYVILILGRKGARLC